MKKSPSFVFKTLLMLLFVAVTATTLNQYAKLIQHLITIKYDWKFEVCMVLGQLIFQLPFILKATAEQKLDYYYNMLIVSTLGSIALLPLIFFNQVYLLTPFINILYFFITIKFDIVEN